jgi:hypothetical protein
VVRNQQVNTAVVDLTVLAIGTDLTSCIAFNDTGSAIWSLLSEPRTANEIANDLMPNFNDEREIIYKDTINFLTSLLDMNFIIVAGK